MLRLGLWGEEVERLAISLTVELWRDLYQMSIIQTVQGIIYDGITLLPPDEQPSADMMHRWKLQVKQMEQKNLKQQVQLVQLRYFFETKHQLRFVLLKGQTLARHYSNPLHRFCGDLDL